MAKLNRKNGSTSNIIRVFLLDSSSTTGAGKTALDHTAAGLIISTIADNEATATTYTSAGSTTETITTLGTFAAPTATKCRFKKVDDTNFPGVYEIQIADARFAVSSAKALLISVQATGVAPVIVEIDHSGQVDTVSVSGTAQTARDLGASVLLSSGTGTGQLDFTSGVVKANATQINAVSTSSVTTVSANVGTTQPINFTGTGASALAKSDMVDVAGAAVSTSTAQLGVNVVNNAGSAITAAAGIQEVKVASIAASAITAASIAADAITDAKVAADVTIASVTGSVGSVTGAVGSVTGAVGSVTGNVGGNVIGSVGSVAAGGIAAASFAAGAINAAAIATDAIDADALAADAVTEIQSGLATAAALSTVSGYIDTEVAAIKAKTDNLPASPASTTNITAGTITTVTNLTNLPTAALSELGADPGATPTLAQLLMLIYMKVRNEETQTATTATIKNNAGTTVFTFTTSDNGTTFTKAKMV